MKFSFIRGSLRKTLRRQVLMRSGFLARLMWHPNPFRSPRRQATIDVGRDAGVGDVLMVTPALRELKRLNPQGRIRFHTNFGDLVRGLPYIDEVLPYTGDVPFIEYVDLMPSPVHIARLMGDRLGVKVTDTQPDCVVDQALVERYRQAFTDLPRPHVVVLRRASRHTPNKDWPDAAWVDVIAQIRRFGSVIEVGGREPGSGGVEGGRYLDLRDKTSIPELVAVVASADIYAGPVSGPMHIAAAVHTPSVLVIGGFEHPANTHYDGNIEFYTPVSCAPCWLLEPCPFQLKCLHAITSAQVADAVRTQWTRLAPAGQAIRAPELA